MRTCIPARPVSRTPSPGTSRDRPARKAFRARKELKGLRAPRVPPAPRAAPAPREQSSATPPSASRPAAPASFLKLDGISGPATQKAYKGSVELQSFAAGAEAPIGNIGGQGTGAGAGALTMQTFQFVKRIDSTSTKLHRDLDTGTALKQAEIDVVHADHKGKATQVASYVLDNVLIKSIDDQGNKETVTGVFAKLEGNLGSGASKVPTGWNKVVNTADWNLISNKAP